MKSRVSGYTCWSTSPVAFDQIWLIDEHPNRDVMKGQTYFHQMPLQSLSLFSFCLLPLFGTLAPWPKYELSSTWTLWTYPEGHDLVWTFSWCVSLMYCYFTVAFLQVSLSASLCPSLWLYIYLLSYWSSSMERPKDVSWAWTEANISCTSKPQATYTAWGDSSFRGAMLRAPVVIPSSILWFFSSTSLLDLSLIKKIRLQQDLVENKCLAHMVDFCCPLFSVCHLNAKIW